MSSGSPPPARRAQPRDHAAVDSRRFTSACAESTQGQPVPEAQLPVHLRLRGEHQRLSRYSTNWAGSPPPARRAPAPNEDRRPARRFTSACAESTSRMGGAGGDLTVHLRLRGEHRPGRRGKDSLTGSPPPARRALTGPLDPQLNPRFTSACAESTPTRRPGRAPRTVHLRLRGEHTATMAVSMLASGSPPPARRALGTEDRQRLPVRFTSACAESTRAVGGKHRRSPVHLRLRGEHVRIQGAVGLPFGSPPPARRAHRAAPAVQPRVRFTSACAESTRRREDVSVRRAVHLRLRGEHGPRTGRWDADYGSPPPARRAQRDAALNAVLFRFTSACAESTRTAPSSRSPRPVHLRLRGEHGEDGRPRGFMCGSPPPARRAPARPSGLAPLRRFTSACAESTPVPVQGGRK